MMARLAALLGVYGFGDGAIDRICNLALALRPDGIERQQHGAVPCGRVCPGFIRGGPVASCTECGSFGHADKVGAAGNARSVVEEL